MIPQTLHAILEEEYPLHPDVIRAYQRDGHTHLRGVLPATSVELFRPRLQDVVREVYSKRSTEKRTEDYSTLFHQIANVWRHDDQLREFVFARRFAKIAAELMGVRGVRLYHDQALFKPPGATKTPFHQDQFYWPLDSPNTITMWMPLVNVSAATGAMMFATGSHREGPLIAKSISEKAGEEFEELVRKRNYPVASYELKAGDATFHSGWVIHGAHSNTGVDPREVLTIIYYEDGARLVEPETQYRKVDMEAFHPGQRPGEPAASPLNPLLYTT